MNNVAYEFERILFVSRKYSKEIVPGGVLGKRGTCDFAEFQYFNCAL